MLGNYFPNNIEKLLKGLINVANLKFITLDSVLGITKDDLNA